MAIFTHLGFIIISLLTLSLNCYETDAREKSNTTAKYVAVILFSLLMLYGAFGNIMMAVVLCCRDSPYSHAFIVITSQLIICDLLTFLPVIVVLPSILQNENQSNVHQMTWIVRTTSSLKPFTFLSLIHFLLLLTINRFVALILPKYNEFFESAKLYFIIILIWFSALGISTVDLYFCTRGFNALKLRWTENCTIHSSEIFLRIRYLWLSLLPIAMFIMYVAMFCSIRRKRRFTSDISQARKTSRIITTWKRMNIGKSYEQSMLIQAALICGFMELGVIFHNLLPLVIEKHNQHDVSLAILINCYSICGRSILPTIYFIYNKRARNFVKCFFLRLHLKVGIGRAAVVAHAN
ncbi:unnamed protein product [Cercopithifilaria johnstoni]|uniref:G-protein coupled receptors family 1 profile domain-containing protein n=1 Tax=Cercopithifilaria johnstoni TaxID=2874296 RepID=A0A8J2M3T7_9BILA|nr:unnamed protein product [Cercopithifilaria johnstoni]